MSLQHIVFVLIIGALAGWIAGLITKGSGFGVVGNILVGIIGAFLGGFCFGLIGIAAFGLIGQLIFAVLGALLFIWLLSFIRK
ncbi:MAG TPA: GlsB/YeaQ/YmgE family stress response membrane protein [Opitutaceae bacterium]